MYCPKFEITPRLLKLVTQATELKIWITQAVVDVTWLPVLQRETTARLAHSSTAIEGNPLTLPEVEALACGENIGGAKNPEKEVKNYLAALRWIWQKKMGHPITESDLLCLHRLLTAEIMAKDVSGDYKIRQNRVVDGSGLTVYTPPGPERAKALTLDLLAWLHGQEVKELHPILVSAITHHRLVSIHPFADGNGRISRAIAIWILYTRGFDNHHLFALDEYYEQDKQRYYDKIQQARDLDDDLTFWIEYVAEGIVVILERIKNRISSLKIKHKSPKLVLTKRQEDVLRFLRDKGNVKSTDLEKVLKVTRARVAVIIRPLILAKIIKREGQSRSTRYRLA